MAGGRDFAADATAVIVLNYNGWRDTIDCVESLLHLPEPLGVFVVDNASSDESVRKLREWGQSRLPDINAERVASGSSAVRFLERRPMSSQGPGPDWPPAESSIGSVVLIASSRNGGYAAGNNVALRFALAEPYRFFWVLNNDTLVKPDTLHWMIARLREDPGIGMCGSTLLYHDEPDTVQNYGGAAFQPWKGRASGIGLGEPFDPAIDRTGVERQLAYVSGASTLVTRRFLETVGLMEESYFLFWEEIDWAVRARGRFRLGFAPRSIVYHRVGASIGTRDKSEQSELAEFYMVRNRVLFCSRYSRRSLPFVLADVGRTMFRRLRRGEWRRAAGLVRAVTGGHLRPGTV
ncbi:glycosyltransferase family 2 protein [Enterovirga aerilata]|uniref:Glycosyltransferase family 2 protein n=1 Tax=Enterovirga aerilata TaxID=2730920 RepID=A0A849IBH8_9HYPH|nr:glycosyltransferase family 2 protein [Enterovirga sp. DB1703]NNM71283.1 glycosyltransferase family 2 protein [Enterovirga sp. DB1703]